MNIAIIAHAGAGKDVTFEILNKHYGYKRYAFADEVKEAAKKYFPHLYNEKNKPRWLLQAIGTKFREIDPEVWIRAMFNVIDANKQYAEKYGYAEEAIAVTDCRLPNEYKALKERGFTFIRINVDEEIRTQRMIERGDNFSKKDMQHHSEQYYDTFECEYEISNNGTLEDLRSEIDVVMKSIMERSAS